MQRQKQNIFGIALICSMLVFLSACGSVKSEQSYPKNEYDKQREKYGSILDSKDDDSGFVLWDSKDRGGKNQGGTLGVNGYLWRATLDTLSFMPLASADSNGGLIITDWYAAPSTPGERVKLNVLIKDKTLRADGVKVTVFRQVKERGEWIDATSNPSTARQLEDAIIARARELKQQQGDKKK